MLTDKSLPSYNKPAIWGGIECTINRIENSFRDQLDYTGHYKRKGDIEAFAGLGITALRYPLLWENLQPDQQTEIDWQWAVQQMNCIRETGMTPIVGLLHHGSGPRYTDLNDPYFPEGLTNYANQIACKFPWVDYYVPVNEPLTTARFSGLYGLWYPHQRSDSQFANIFLNQLRAIVLAMQAIKKINPDAKLVQTEDLGFTHSTAMLAYQAEFENNRRWLTFDFLCGRVNKHHPLWDYFINAGIPESTLNFFLDNVCTPDILGINYYVTSERYLDEHLDQYPPHTHGGNIFHEYADIEVVRSVHGQAKGLYNILMEAWDRYHIPIAVTEAHLNCSREEQMRWFVNIWDEACAAKQNGAIIEGVTAWSLLGSFDWDSLLTKKNGNYETGVFSIENDKLRPTAMVKLLRALIRNGDFKHPLLNANGWWQRNHATETNCNKNALLLFAFHAPVCDACKVACNQRAIEIDYTRDNQASFSFLILSKIIEEANPWSIIFVCGLPHDEDDDLIRRKAVAAQEKILKEISIVCLKKKIPLMVFYQGEINCEGRYIGMRYKNISQLHSPAAWHGALDILIDEAYGHWDLQDCGKCKRIMAMKPHIKMLA